MAYSLEGTDSSSFSIDTEGLISFNSAPNYESTSSYQIIVKVTDGTDTTSKVVNINIIDVNEAPTFELDEIISIKENSSLVTTISANDEDGDNLSYVLGGTDIPGLSINSSGLITFNSPPDYESKNSYSINVSVYDGELFTTKPLTIQILNVLEATQLGGIIAGTQSYERPAFATSSISFSADGSKLGIGSRYHDDDDENSSCDSGRVRIFEYSSGNWVQFGPDIKRSADNQCGRELGYSVSLNNNGTVVAVGVIGDGGDASGSGEVYEYVSGNWILKGSTISTSTAGAVLGRVIKLDKSGTKLAIAGGSSDAGIYHFESNNWVKKLSLSGQTSFSFSSDGSILSMGNSIQTLIFQSGSWSTRGSVIFNSGYTSSGLPWTGPSVSLSGDGNNMVVGMPGGSCSTSDTPSGTYGYIKVYEWLGTEWNLIQEIRSDQEEDCFGLVTAMNSEGNIIAVGSPTSNYDGGGYKGSVKLYEKIDSTWQESSEITSSYPGPNFMFGRSITMSEDGSLLAVGAPFGSGGSPYNEGYVLVYQIQ